MEAAAVVGAAGALAADILKWGFIGFDKGRLLINARAESVRTKQTFAESFAARRCVLPAAGFYEWDKKKEKVIFRSPDRTILYLAGIYRPFGDEKRFVILTREPGEEIRFIHDRMPLIMPEQLVNEWIRPDVKPEELLPYALTDMIFEKAAG